jgi:hypothetical protein
VCHHCHEKGHIKWHCEQWKKDKKKKKKQVQKQADSDSDSEGGRISAVEEIMSRMKTMMADLVLLLRRGSL